MDPGWSQLASGASSSRAKSIQLSTWLYDRNTKSRGNLLTSSVSTCERQVLTMINGSLLEYAEPVWLSAATAEPGTLRA